MTSTHLDHSPGPPGPGVEPPAAVLWDMDGTLVDTEPYWFSAERDLVDEFGHGQWPDELAHGMVGFDLLDGAAYLQENGGVDLPAAEIVDRLLDGVIARLHRRIPWQPGARELLADLNAAGVPCALVTMSWRRFVAPVVAALPADSFVAIITGDEVPEGRGKPHADPYLIGAKACGAHPEDCVAIEDSPTGVRSALRAGCAVLGVPNVRSLQTEPGLTIVHSLDDVRVDDLGLLLDAPAASIPAERTQRQFGRRPLVTLAVLSVLAVIAGFTLFGGGDDEAPALPPGAVPIDAWVPYWTLADVAVDAGDRFPDMREVSPFWFGARGATEISIDDNAPAELTDRLIDQIRGSSAKVVPSIRDEMPAGGMAAVLSDPTTRAQHVTAIVDFADRLDVDGIDLDYEQFAFADGEATWQATRPNWVAFVQDLARALHRDDRTLTVSVPAVFDVTPEGSGGYWVYDHGTIAGSVDAIRIMAYDYSVAEPGPIAPLAWVGQAVAGVSDAVPEEFHDRLVLGVPSYGTNWVVSTEGTCPASAEGRTNVTARTALDLAERRSATPLFDPGTAEWSFSYSLTVTEGANSCVQERSVHWVDAEGVASRVEIARRAGWGGVALWALGYEDDAVWDSMVTSSRVSLPPEG